MRDLVTKTMEELLKELELKSAPTEVIDETLRVIADVLMGTSDAPVNRTVEEFFRDKLTIFQNQ